MKTTKIIMRTLFPASLMLALAVAVTAQAQQAPAVSDAGVARLSVMQGDVSSQRGTNGDWAAAAVNEPLLEGDSIATAAGARGEVQLDFADRLRLDANSQATLAALTRSQIKVQVGQGLVDYVVVANGEAGVEVDTPNLAVRPQGAGVIRIQVNSESESLVTVRRGSAEVSTPQGSTTLASGQTITVEGTDTPEYQISDAAPLDGFDQWNQERDRTLEAAASWSHTNRYYTGAGDLDGYGRWVFVPGYGQVWQPAVGPAWTPYSVGRWVWEPGWGWTWVSSEAWGWAPYHYGRWFYYQTGWVWWPGPVAVTPMYRPVWSPAYVAFVGLRAGGVSVGVGFGSVGWVPVGPGDVYRPWWGAGVRVGVGFGVASVRVVEPLAPVVVGRVVYTNVTRIGVDPHITRAVVSVPAGQFGRGVVVRERVSVTEIRRAQVMNGRLPMEHTAASLRVSERVVDVHTLPRAATAPPRRYFAATEATRAPMRPEMARPAAAPRPENAPRAGFHRFGDAPAAENRGNGASRPAPAAREPGHENDPAWHRFNQAPAKADKGDNAARGGRKENEKKPGDKTPPRKVEGGGGGGGGGFSN